MRDEDRDELPLDDDIYEEDPDFDSIRGTNISAVSPSDESGSAAETKLESLSDRALPTVETAALPTSSHRVSQRSTPSSQPSYRPETVATTPGVITPTPRRSLTVIEPTTVPQGAESPDEVKEFPSQVNTIGLGEIGAQQSHRVTDPIRLNETLPKEAESIGTIRQTALETDDQTVTTKMTPDTYSAGTRSELEPENLDPGYEWTGGVPYSTTTPQCIIHVAPKGFESLPFLQRVLRDTYSELEGGRPRTETLGVRAGRFDRVRIHGSIITLDLTTDAWEIDTSGQVTLISYGEQDMIPALRDLIDSLYGGKLGYLVMNIESEVLESRFQEDVPASLVAALLDIEPSAVQFDADGDLLSRIEPPIRIAEPRRDSDAFQRVVGQYFGFPEAVDDRVADVEAAQDARVRRSDWRRVALTERQSGEEREGGESDEHYLWKAMVADGLAWQLRAQFIERNEMISFDRFVEQYLLPDDGPIQSEADVGEGVADLVVEPRKTERWVWNGVRKFLAETQLEPSDETPVAFEFETGRGEGAFNFRKVRETLEKYDDNPKYKVCVVVPPRMLFRSEPRARMLERLVDVSGRDDDDPDVELCLPELGTSGCRRHLSATTRFEEWFGDTDE